MPEPVATPFEQRITQAAKVMGISTKDLWYYLNILGIENNPDGQALLEAETTREGDARAVMVEGKGTDGEHFTYVKIARFSAGWVILKGKGSKTVIQESSSDIAKLVDTIKRVEQRTNEELLQMYKPEASYEILEELRKRCHDRPCIIFNEDAGNDTIDLPNSLKLLRIAHRQETPSTYTVQRADGSQLVRVHRVGDFPMTFVEECPLHSNTILAEDQCEECQETWDGIPTKDRTIIRVAADTGMLDTSPAKICELIERLRKEGAGFLLKIGKIGLIYRELQEENKLPILRHRISRTVSGKSDPLFIHRQ